MFGMVLDAEVPLNHLGDARGSPQFVGITVSRRSLQEKSFQDTQLRIGQTSFGTGSRFGNQAIRLASHSAPTVQGRKGHAQNACNGGR